MKTSDAFPSKYLKADDFDADTTLTISYVEMDTLKNKKGKDQQKPICYFKETDKGLVLNKTNWDAIAKQYGDESDNWTSHAIVLTVIDVDAFGETKPAIRVKAPRKVSANPIRTNAPAPDKQNGNSKSRREKLIERYNALADEALTSGVEWNPPPINDMTDDQIIDAGKTLKAAIEAHKDEIPW